MSPEFAQSLVDMRLRQVSQLLEWMLENVETDVESVASALVAVVDAHRTIKDMSVAAEAVAGLQSQLCVVADSPGCDHRDSALD